MDHTSLKNFLSTFWDKEVIPTLSDYIKIPALSPMFDHEWPKTGAIDDAIKLCESWARKHLEKIPGVKIEVLRTPNRTPLLYIDIPGTKPGTALLYGHIDKQPEATGWSEGLGPWKPVFKNERLYGRGSVDDGYAMFTAIASIVALEEQKIPHARCVVIIETGEESASPDIPYYINFLKSRLEDLDLIVCLDSGCGTFDHLWLTTSLRGLASGNLKVQVLTNGCHSGHASGIVPSSFRILRMLLSRLENETTGEILLKEACTEIPADKLEQAHTTVAILANSIVDEFPFAGKTKPMTNDLVELTLNRAWRPQLAITALEGYPKPENAGNVVLPCSIAKLSLRTPPGCDAKAVVRKLKRLLEADPPYDAVVSFENAEGNSGWNAPAFTPWLEDALKQASIAHFGNAPAYFHQGGSIGFVGMLAEMFPKAQFIVTGVSAPDSNPHGPDECLHIPSAKKLTACISEILCAHGQKSA